MSRSRCGVASIVVVVLLLVLPDAAPATASSVCSSADAISATVDSSGSRCFLLQVPAGATLLSLVLDPKPGASSFDLYHNDSQVGFLSELDRVNFGPITSSATYALEQPVPGANTVAVDGTGPFHLEALASSPGTGVSNLPSNQCDAGTCQTLFSLTIRAAGGAIQIGPKFGDRVIFPIELGAPGTIRVEANWSGPANSLALILNGPDHPDQPNPQGAYARVDGASPLVLTYSVTPADFLRGSKWRVSLVNFTTGGGQDTGNVAITYPRPPAHDLLAAHPALPDFVGSWRNVDSNTRGITRFEVAQSGTRVGVHSWGACVPVECDNGTASVVFDGNPVRIQKDFSFKREVLTLWLLNSGQLRAVSDNVFTDGTNRDYASQSVFSRTSAPPNASLPLDQQLLGAGEQHQVIQFNAGAALQKSIFADGFVPNSAEFGLSANGLTYAAQRAEHLATGVVRVYNTQVGDWGNIQFVQRPNSTGTALGDQLLSAGQVHQVMQFNADAALQRRIFADGYVPNSAEFGLSANGLTYAAQRAEHLATGVVRVYYVQGGDWGNIQFVQRK